MTDYYADHLVKALEDRNEIERQKLEFEKAVFEFNKQLSIDNTTSNVDIANSIAAMVDKINWMNETVKALAQNDAYLNKELEALKFSVLNLQ